MDSLQGIQEQLATIAKQREQERVAAHEDAMKAMAEFRKKEEQRQAVAKEAQRLAKERKIKADQSARDSEQARLREEEAERHLAEQEENRKQEAINIELKFKADLEKRMLEMEHAEEQAKKTLRDAMLLSSTPVDTERIMPNPLQRFLQQVPE